MIVCPKCKAENSPAGENCVKCGHSLLPKRTVGERIVGLIIGIICLLIILVLSTRMIAGFWIGIFILGGITAAAFFFALGPQSLAEKYEDRANKYKESDPEQAIADYTKALDLGKTSGKVSAKIFFERGKLYRKMGRREEALADLNLAYTAGHRTAMKKEIEKEIQAVSAELPLKPSPPPTPALKKYCRYCGASLAAEATFCTKCGKKQ